MVKEALLGVWATCVLLAFAVPTVTAAAPPSVALSATTVVPGGTVTATIAEWAGECRRLDRVVCDAAPRRDVPATGSI